MGLLSEGTPYTWSQTKEVARHVQKEGIKQFISIYHNLKDRENDCLLWGDEVEMTLVHLDNKAKKARLALSAADFLTKLVPKEGDCISQQATWHPEYARYMLEGTPSKPYQSSHQDFLNVERNMQARRRQVEALLDPEYEAVVTITSWPELGTPEATYPTFTKWPPHGQYAESLFVDDSIINPHPRFGTLTRNIRERRQRKVEVILPVFKDKNTPIPLPLPDVKPLEETNQNPSVPSSNAILTPLVPAHIPDDHVYMDCMAFGMGCSCLQCTMQGVDIDETRWLYDQLSVFCPVMLALSAAAPIFRGWLVDVDSRWDVISMAVDSRTKEEAGLEPLKTPGARRVFKSRYASIDCYISTDERNRPELNDIEVPIDEEAFEECRAAGIDEQLSRHIAHLFIHDPMVVYGEKLDQDPKKDNDHFENIQSTNWQNVRFKPPPPNTSIGWRVEFRPMEVQITDFENAALIVFVVLLSRTILSFDLDLYLPISRVDANMDRAQKRDAVNKEKFFWRKSVTPLPAEDLPSSPAARFMGGDQQHYTAFEDAEMSINQIVNGEEGMFVGLLPLVKQYLNTLSMPISVLCRVNDYLDLISRRASGDLETTATWMRNFVMNHPKYQGDSRVSSEINYDMIDMMRKIQTGEVKAPSLLGQHGDRNAKFPCKP